MKLKRIITFLVVGALALSTVLTGCGSSINPKAVGATLDGREISLGFLNFLAKYQQATNDNMYRSFFGDEAWSQDLGDGTSLQESLKSQVVENVQNMYLLEAHMAEYDVEMTDKELADIDAATEQFIADNSTKAKKQMGATKEYVTEMIRLQRIQQKMREKIIEKIDREVSDEEAAQRTFSYINVAVTAEDENSDGADDSNDTENDDVDATENVDADTAENGDEGNLVKSTDEEKAEEVAKAAKIDFEKAAEDAGYTVATHSYGKEAEDDTMAEEVIVAADKLAEGEISDVVTTAEDGYYIIRLDSAFDEEATEAKKEEIITQREDDLYTEVCDSFKETSKIELNEEAWAKVVFDKQYTVVSTKDEETTGGDEEATGGDEEATEK
ncbi:peptidyl-prolyl cis-trans isomerase [Lachnospiraceae bacterium ZAX-1]